MAGLVKHVLLSALLLPAVYAYSPAQQHEEFRAENITSEYIRIEKGLSQNTAFCVMQDSRGFIWTGTWSGLNRFDGYEVKSFNKNYYEPERGLTNPTVVGLAEDKQGMIWVATIKGLNKIDPFTFEITQFTAENFGAKGLVSDSLTTIYLSQDNLLWLGTRRGVITMNPQTEELTHFMHNPRDSRTLSDRHVTCFAEHQENMWIGTRNGLNLMVRKNNTFTGYYAGEEAGQLTSSHITCLEFCQEGFLWVGTDYGLNRLEKDKNWFDPFFLVSEQRKPSITSRNYISCLFNDDQNDLWVGTHNLGLFFLDKEQKRFSSINRYVPDDDLLQANDILDIAKDKTGLYWIGTSHRGLIKLIPEPHAFRSHLRGSAIFGIAEYPSRTFWFGTQNGVSIYDYELNRTIHRLEHDPNDENSLSSNLITTFFLDEPHQWIGTRNGLNRYHLKTGKNQRFLSGDQEELSIAGPEVWGITKASDQHLWIATNNGITRYQAETGSTSHFRHDPENPNSLSSNACRQVFELEPGVFLISTDYGLNKYNQASDLWHVYLPIPDDLLSISSESVFGVFRDSHNEIWVYTNGGGINRFDPVTGTFEHFTDIDGLSDNIVYGMTEDEFGYYWIITNNGLSRFDPAEERFIQFDAQDGLLSNEFNLNGIFVSSEHEVFAASVNGVSSFYPFRESANLTEPSVRFTRLVVHNEREETELPARGRVELKYDQNSFQVSFAVMDYTNPFKNRFEYQLRNYDASFTTLPEGENQIAYRKMRPGNYTLVVKGYNSYGLSATASMEIVIIPAWFQTLFFKVFSVLFLLGLFGLIAYLRYSSIRNRHRMEKKLLTIQNELVQSQKFALRSQMNPHFIFNSLNSIQNFVLKNDVDAANYYLSNFSILMRRVLEYSNYNLITLDEEIQLIELYIKMEKLRFSNKFEVKIQVDTDIDVHLVKIPPMLLQPYLENAILHGLQLIRHKGLLELRFLDQQDHMRIEIQDNGIGRARANEIRSKQAHKSKGLKNIEKRIQLYNKINTVPIEVHITDLFVTGNPAGTLVTLTIPYELDEPES